MQPPDHLCKSSLYMCDSRVMARLSMCQARRRMAPVCARWTPNCGHSLLWSMRLCYSRLRPVKDLWTRCRNRWEPEKFCGCESSLVQFQLWLDELYVYTVILSHTTLVRNISANVTFQLEILLILILFPCLGTMWGYPVERKFPDIWTWKWNPESV